MKPIKLNLSTENVNTLSRDIYKVLNKQLVSDYASEEQLNDKITEMTIMGTTYNFLESPIAHLETISYGDNSEGITLSDALEAIVDKLSKDQAIDSATISVMVEIFEILNLTLNPSVIKNREFLLHYYAGHESEIPDNLLYQVLFFLLTGRTTYVRTFREFRRANATISANRFQQIARIIRQNGKGLAKNFRRNRSLMMFIKRNATDDGVFSTELRHEINRIARLSHRVNVAQKQPVSTRQKEYSLSDLQKMKTSDLTRMLYASDIVTVRNGRQYKVAKLNTNPYPRDLIMDVLAQRDDVFTDEQKTLAARGWEIAIPQSGKRGLGNLPNGSRIRLKLGDKIGIRWFDEDSDLDLSGFVYNHKQRNPKKYGWDSDKHGDLDYSGDMTSTIYNPTSKRNEAVETLKIQTRDVLEKDMLFDVSTYRSNSGELPAELIVGDEVVPMSQPVNKQTLGYVHNGYLYIWNQSYGNDLVNISNGEEFSSEFFKNEGFYLN